MKITLRKASAIQLLINEFLNGSTIGTSVSIGRYDDPAAVTAKASETFNGALVQKLALTKTLYSLRKKVSAASQVAGIPDILADIALTDKHSAILRPLATVSKFAPGADVIAAQLADLKAEVANANSYSRRDSFDISILSVPQVQEFMGDLSTLRKRKQNLSDKLLELNIKNEIELDEAEEKVLKAYDLV